MKLTYTAITRDGKKVKGTIEGKDAKDAASFLRTKGMLPTQVTPELESQLLSYIPFVNRVGLGDLVFFTRELSSMFSSGIPLVQALRILKEQVEKKALVEVITGIIADVEDGKSMHVAIAKYPEVFPPLYISLVKSAEAGGLLDKILARLAENLDKQQRLRDEVRAALFYPAMVIVGMVVVAFITMMTAVPALKSLYGEYQAELPLPTLMLIGMSEFVTNFWYLIIGGIIVGIFLYRNWVKTEAGKVFMDNFVLKLPVIGKLLRETVLAEVTRTLGLLIGSGALVVPAIRGAAGSADNRLYQTALINVANRVEKGVSVGDAMSAYAIFPPIMTHMVRLGEQTGKLDESLLKVSVYFEREVEQMIKTLNTALQPFILVVLGGGVIFLLLAIFLPMFNLVSVVK